MRKRDTNILITRQGKCNRLDCTYS